MKINKLKYIIAAFIFSIIFILPVSAKNVKSSEGPEPVEEKVPEGKIIVLVVDISQSIKAQLPMILDGLCSQIVDGKMGSHDACVIVPLGDLSNVNKATYFTFIMGEDDKVKAKNYIQGMKEWMPTNLNTDIGAAMKKTIELVNKIDNESYAEPLVLFITDGDIYQSKNSKEVVEWKTPEEIFANSMMNSNLYDNWWFLGIENDVDEKPEQIKQIAEIVGAYQEDNQADDRFEYLTNMNMFGQLFDSWLASIPDPEPKEQAKVDISSEIKFEKKALKDRNSKYTPISNETKEILWSMTNKGKRKYVKTEIKSIVCTFRSENGQTVTIPIDAENDPFEIEPRKTTVRKATIDISNVNGKGLLKFTINPIYNGEDGESRIIESNVNFLTPKQLFIRNWGPVFAAIILIILIIVIVKILKSVGPVKVVMEIVGKANKAKPVSMKINKHAEIGTKVGIPFKLESSNYPSVVGELVRTGKKTWKIVQRDVSSFVDNQKIDPYKMNDSIKFVGQDGCITTVRFRIKK